MTGIGDVAQLAGLAVRRPLEFYDRVQGRRERGQQLPPPELDAVTADPVRVAHELVGVADTGCCADALVRVREQVLTRLGPERHNHDGGTTLAEMLWVIVRHARPRIVIETGVARGVSSAFILDALMVNGTGHLWSIDLPPMGAYWRTQSGVAVADELRDRWTYLRGSSRRLLPRLMREERAVDLFVHDGLHTAENMLFEMRTVWGWVRPGGFLVSDDADDNHAVLTFADEIGQKPTLVREEGKEGVVGVFRKGQ